MATGLGSWDTVAELISDAAIELGLVPAAISDPFGSQDQNILQMIGLLKSAGREIVREHQWSHLVTEYTLATVPGTAIYPLPADFRGLINQTGWNRTTMYELGGPLSAEEWQFLQAVPWAGSITSFARFQGGQLSISPTPGAVQTIAFEYLTTNWIMPSGQTSPTSDKPALAADTVCFDPLLIVRALKLAWKRDKGFDTTSVLADYRRALDAAVSADSPAPVLHPGKGGGVPMLGVKNMPLTGVGQ